MLVTRFEDLRVWQGARALNKSVYQLTRKRPMAQDHAFVDQLRRSSLSIMNNVAEGFDRYRRNEFLQFLSVAKGSAGEVRSMLYAALDLGYIDEPTFNEHMSASVELGSTLASFRSGLERSKPKVLRRGSPIPRNGKPRRPGRRRPTRRD